MIALTQAWPISCRRNLGFGTGNGIARVPGAHRAGEGPSHRGRYGDRGFSYLLTAGASLRDVWADAVPALLGALQVAVLCAGIGAIISVWTPQNRARMVGQRGSALLGTLVGFVLMFAATGVLLFAWLLLEDTMPAILRVLVTAPFAVLAGALLVALASSQLARNPWRMERKLLGA